VVLPQAILKGHLQDCWRRLRALRQPIPANRALYIIWAGANDYLGGATDSTAPINNLVMVKSISAVGAKILWWSTCPIWDFQARAQASVPTFNNLTQSITGLATALNDLRQELSSDINITYLDVNSRFNQVINEPEIRFHKCDQPLPKQHQCM